MSLPRAKLTSNFPGCPVEATLSFLDGKWKGVILFHLMSGTLRELEESGLVSRTVFPVVPPRVDYALTPLGLTLRPVIKALATWGEENVFCLPEGRHLRDVSVASGVPAATVET